MSLVLRKSWLMACLCLSLLGCGESAPPPETEAIGAQARTQVQNFVEAAKKTPAKAPQQIAVLKESLVAYVDQYGKEFEPVKQAADELEALYQRKAPKAEIDAGLQKLSDAANELPN